MTNYKSSPISKIIQPIQRFIQKEKSGGLVLGVSVLLALFFANSFLHSHYFEVLQYKLGIFFEGESYFEFSIHQWINDGLMAIFFFVVGLELKREIVAGELSDLRKASLPIIAALGGMAVPALIYLLFNSTGEVSNGWGIPMATDIAFALGILYLLGDRIPLSLKVFLTAVAIVDDLGAVLVIAFFYTSDISFLNLILGIIILLTMFIGNRMGVRSIMFYALLGIGGVWTMFLLSGVHATIAAVLAAFMIPADVKIDEQIFIARIKKNLTRFKNADPNQLPTLTNEQLYILERIAADNKKAMPPLQRLEHAMHPFVTFIVLPIFALANAGVSVLDIEMEKLFDTNVVIGVTLGLLFGKIIGVVGFTWLSVKLKIASFPQGMNLKNLLGLGFLTAIGFTMSLFITQLAFIHEDYQTQAKIGIFVASILGGVIGFSILKRQKSPAAE